VTNLLLAVVFASEVAVGLAGSVDLATTEVMLRRGGYAEANPVMASNTGGRILLKVGATATVIAVSRELRRHGKPRAAKILCWTAAGIWLGAAAWNAHQLQRSKR
jgi:hypothetical protein